METSLNGQSIPRVKYNLFEINEYTNQEVQQKFAKEIAALEEYVNRK